ncbi:hypothetical protein CK203_049403 [Vitis vinifera]|uniref:Uncharacterized protein n=1 Tax=Vitis vinifera TaxID=29760 RepID=A0A438FVK4_VITVI|nr:hypothetical protein CK203_049403 [Vitis vinifera]
MKGVEYESKKTLGLLAGIDLSSKKLSGDIPEELTRLHGTKIHGFSPFNFITNPKLCGAPLTDGCGEDGKPKGPIPDNDDEEDNGWIDMKWFYLGMPWGFVVGFWAIFGSISIQQSLEICLFSVPG